jgi:hypothetical protein
MDETHAEGCGRRIDLDRTCSCGGVRLKGGERIISFEHARGMWGKTLVDEMVELGYLQPMEGAAYYFYNGPKLTLDS